MCACHPHCSVSCVFPHLGFLCSFYRKLGFGRKWFQPFLPVLSSLSPNALNPRRIGSQSDQSHGRNFPEYPGNREHWRDRNIGGIERMGRSREGQRQSSNNSNCVFHESKCYERKAKAKKWGWSTRLGKRGADCCI